MRWAKIAAGLTAVVALASVAYFKWARDANPGPQLPPPAPPRYGGPAVWMDEFRKVRLQVPKAFAERPPQKYGKGQMIYMGPKGDGSPQIQIYSGPRGNRNSLDASYRYWRQKYSRSTPARQLRILEEGRTNIAGRAARTMLVEDIVSGKSTMFYMAVFVTKEQEHFLRGWGRSQLFRKGRFRETLNRVFATARVK